MAMTAKDVKDQDQMAIVHMIKHYENIGDEAKAQLYRSILEESGEDD